MNADSSNASNLQTALEALIKTVTVEEAYQLLERYPELVSDQADLFISSIMDTARKQGHDETVAALDERRAFLRNARLESSEQEFIPKK